MTSDYKLSILEIVSARTGEIYEINDVADYNAIQDWDEFKESEFFEVYALLDDLDPAVAVTLEDVFIYNTPVRFYDRTAKDQVKVRYSCEKNILLKPYEEVLAIIGNYIEESFDGYIEDHKDIDFTIEYLYISGFRDSGLRNRKYVWSFYNGRIKSSPSDNGITINNIYHDTNGKVEFEFQVYNLKPAIYFNHVVKKLQGKYNISDVISGESFTCYMPITLDVLNLPQYFNDLEGLIKKEMYKIVYS